MNSDCQCIIFSYEAYNAIMTETFKMDPNETGGILLGHILDNGIWIVMEVLPPGWRSIFQYAYFEYDEDFVNYVAQNESKKYEQELNLLGLWHRHPGSMDTFSGTDNGTNRIFACLHPKGAISGLVNIDPRFRLTMYHCSKPLRYSKVDVEVGDDLIPEEYFKLKYYDEEKELNPYPPEEKNARKNIDKEKKYVIGSGTRYNKNDKECKNNNIGELLSNIMKTSARYLFLAFFVTGLVLSLNFWYSYNKLKDTDDMKSLYRIVYSEYPPNYSPSTDSINTVKTIAAQEFDTKEKPSLKIRLKYKDLLFAQHKSECEEFINNQLRKNPSLSSEALEKQFNDSLFNEDRKILEIEIGKYLEQNDVAETEIIKESLTANYEDKLIEPELSRQKQGFIDGKVADYQNIYADFYKNLSTEEAASKVRCSIIMLFIGALLSLFIAFIMSRNKKINDWIIIGSAFTVSLIFLRLFPYNVLSPAYFISLIALLVILCFIAYITISVWDTFKNKLTKKKDTKYWYQIDSNLYNEEKSIKSQYSNAEKNIENGVVSFFVPTDKKINNQLEPLVFQLVYPSNYIKNKDIKVYLVSPDLDSMLGNQANDFPYIEIDKAGEKYLELSSTIPKDKINGLEIIKKVYKWIDLYNRWQAVSIDIKDLKL